MAEYLKRPEIITFEAVTLKASDGPDTCMKMPTTKVVIETDLSPRYNDRLLRWRAGRGAHVDEAGTSSTRRCILLDGWYSSTLGFLYGTLADANDVHLYKNRSIF